MDIQLSGLFGLFGGALMGFLGWWLGRKQANKNRGLDELYRYIWEKARSYTWYITLVVIYILFSLVAIGIEMSPAMVLGILLLSHMGGWGCIGIALSIHMSLSETAKSNEKTIGIIMITLIVIVCTILSIATKNWVVLFISIPPVAFIFFLTFILPKKNTD